MKVDSNVPISEREAPSVAMDLDSPSAVSAVMRSNGSGVGVHRFDIRAKVVDRFFHLSEQMEHMSHVAMHVADTMLCIVQDVLHQIFQVMEFPIDGCQISFNVMDAGTVMGQLVNMSGRVRQAVGIGHYMIVMGRMSEMRSHFLSELLGIPLEPDGNLVDVLQVTGGGGASRHGQRGEQDGRSKGGSGDRHDVSPVSVSRFVWGVCSFAAGSDSEIKHSPCRSVSFDRYKMS